MESKSPWVLGIGEVLWDMLPEGKQCGGAPANVVYHLTRLGIQSAIVSAAGRDVLGDELVNFLESKGVCTDFIARNDLKTGVVEVSLDNGIPQYDICSPSAWDRMVFTPQLRGVLPDVRAAVFGTLAQRSPESRNTIREILKNLPASCLKIFDINLRQNYYDEERIRSSLGFCDILKINEEELTAVAELFCLRGSGQEIVRTLAGQHALQAVILTSGEKGSTLFDGNAFSEYPVSPCRVVDTGGCGDAFLAAWCATFLNGGTMQDAMRAGTRLSAEVASQKGAMGE